MTGRHVPVHYLRPNHAERTPTDVVVFDTETSWVDTDTAQVHRLRCWVASHDRRHDTRKKAPGTTWANGDTAEALCDLLETHARSGVSLWVFAHNLSFDLAVVPLPELLAARGWTLTEFSARSDHPWFRLTRGNHRITITDSHSWVPTSLDELSKTSTLSKPPLPTDADDPTRWLHRCTADVALTREAVLTVLDWWETEQLGRFTISGPACGWNAFRHRFYSGQLLVDPDPTLRAFERRALYGGRREAFRVGCSPRSTYADVDFVAAYPTLAGAINVPVRRVGVFHGLSDDDPVWHRDDQGVVANVEVITDTPCVPARVNGSVLYPVGHFRSVLTSVEIEHARDLGATVHVGSGMRYQLAPLLHEWSRWVLSTTGPDGDTLPAPVRFLLKHWGRTVIGRFASRSSTTQRWGDAPGVGWRIESGHDLDSGNPISWVDVGTTRYLVTHDTEPDNALPAVTAWVEAACRVHLDRGMTMTGAARVLSCDTDGWLVDLQATGKPWGPEACRKPATFKAMPKPPGWVANPPSRVGPLEVRPKAYHRHVDILGPAHLWLDGERHLSGVPRAAQLGDDGRYHAVLWPKLGYQLSDGAPGVYTRPRVPIAITGPYSTRWVTDGGRTVAPAVALVDGENRVMPWSPSDTEREGAGLLGPQHPTLTKWGVHDDRRTA